MIKHAERMAGVHPDLIKVMTEAGNHADFVITCGLRTKEEQVKMVATGRSHTMQSRHLTGHAVDVAIIKDKQVSWDFIEYKKFAAIVLDIARDMNIPIVWGGEWRILRDGPHFELNRKQYPPPPVPQSSPNVDV